MKIEKISDSQIRCTLTHADLADRNLQFSDLVFRKDNAKSLFEDIMITAQKQYNFTPGDGPLMIEALPNQDESITLIFTKVDENSPLLAETFGTGKTTVGESTLKSATDKTNSTNPNTDIFSTLIGSVDYQSAKALEEELGLTQKRKPRTSKLSKTAKHSHIFSFRTFDEVLDCVNVVGPAFMGCSNLHFDKHNDLFILTLSLGNMDQDLFNRVCNTVTEFGILEVCNEISLAYLEEHCRSILSNNAVETLLSI